jgi:phenylpropionate dioxygenase-like ring-hydroxylating dioxygenase large terminal subunit
MARLSDAIDHERGLISREIFVSPTYHQAELETVFTRAWLFVGHESQIPNPGDFFTSRMGEESVILCRDAKGAVHVFLNSCRHRGMKVCRYEQGNTSLFVCPYHSWSYTTDGKLQGVPLYRVLYEGQMQREDWSLIEVPRLCVYKGTVWASWDAQAPDFLTYIGDAIDQLDAVLDCRDGRPGGSEVIGVHKWVFPSNWKFAAENFLGDSYHNPSHRSVDMIGMSPSARRGQRRDNDYARAQRVWVAYPQGHGVTSGIAPPDAPYEPSYEAHPDVEAYFRHCHEERQRRLGEKARLLSLVGTFFPNTAYHGRQPRSLCVWHPHGPLQTEGWRFFLVDADAPAAVKDILRRYYMRYSGPAGMTEQDDMENWLYATAASNGTIARRYPFNYQMSMGAPNATHLGPGMVATQMTDQTPRNFYRVYARYLDGADWDSLLGRDLTPTREAAE